MAESPDKAAKSAEDAYAAAAAEARPAKSDAAKAEAAPVAFDKPAPDAASVEARAAKAVKPAAASAADPVASRVAAPKETTPATKKSAAIKSRIKSKPRRTPARKAAPIADNAPVPTITELKEKIMATAKPADYSKPYADAMSEVRSKAKAAYDKGADLAAEMTDFAKGNVEALVESGKIYAAGVQDLGKTYAEEAKTAYETLTADLKEVAAVKSPVELFQLQARLARRNFDALVAYGSKNTDAAIKLANETFAPISGRISLAAEKLSKAA